MRTSHSLLAAAAASLLVTAGCAKTAVVRYPAGTPAAPLLLSARVPDVSWNSHTLVKADFDGDGTVDWAEGGVKGDRYVVGILHGPLSDSSRVSTLDFGVKEGDQDSLCSLQASLAVEDLDTSEGGDDVAPNAKGIALHDDRCDAFHIFWNTRTKRYDWWRL